MSLTVKVKPKSEKSPIPEGTYAAICYTIADLGMQYSERYKKSQQKILFIWEIVDDSLRIEIDGVKKRRAISKSYTASFGKKSAMRAHLRPWLGRDFTEEELAGYFDVSFFIGRACLLSIVNETNDDGEIYSAISGVMQLPSGTNVGEAENPIVIYDADESTNEELEKLPEWVQDKIKNAKTVDMSAANSIDVKIDTQTGEITKKPVVSDDLP